MNRLLGTVGRALSRFIEKPLKGYQSFSTTTPERLRRTLRPCDVLLVEGNSRVASAIKYLTNSTWSHVAFYAGGDDPDTQMIEADLQEGVRAVPVSHFAHLNTRICRPIGLTPEDEAQIIAFMRGSIGKTYDLKNIFDLLRYLLPNPPVPARFRRKMLELGSGDPTRAICSTLIAEAFQSVRYPILPILTEDCDAEQVREILSIRHHSLFAPRDFDLSPYFRIVKPTIEYGFDYRTLTWADRSSGTDALPGAHDRGPAT
ncbi:hypothetical protein SL1157_2649 [Ruegeria lacuscaerulensis ITI-1157]|nr:hypothetical protein SL1157_2649 [Ruegeria lacuscaerulensis ITI-1157]SHJ16820.1 Permuted papain-like amidase enzyme, YaeF/YiiX, C92 family [Ruegeria lacuscaerulensis ITI-1157]